MGLIMGLYVGWFGLCAPASRSVRGRASCSLGAREHLVSQRQDRSICGGRRRAQTVKLKLRSRRCERRDRGRETNEGHASPSKVCRQTRWEWVTDSVLAGSMQLGYRQCRGRLDAIRLQTVSWQARTAGTATGGVKMSGHREVVWRGRESPLSNLLLSHTQHSADILRGRRRLCGHTHNRWQETKTLNTSDISWRR